MCYKLTLISLSDSKENQETPTSDESYASMLKIVENIRNYGCEEVLPFKNGLAPVKKDGKFGFINKYGEIVTAFAFDDVWYQAFNKEVPGFIVYKHYPAKPFVGERTEKKKGYIDTSGKLINSVEYDYIERVDRYLHLVRFYEKEHSCDIYDIETGKVVATDIRSRKGDYDISISYFWKNANSDGIHTINGYYYNKDGEKIIDHKFKETFGFSENVAVVLDSDDRWKIIDCNGFTLTCFPTGMRPDDKNYGKEFKDGLIIVEDSKTYKKGYMDKTGNVVIAPRFSHAHPFHNNLAAVYENNCYEYIDKTGMVVIPADSLIDYRGKSFSGDYIVAHCTDIDAQVVINRFGDQLSIGQLLGADDPDAFSYGFFPYSLIPRSQHWCYVDKDFSKVCKERFYIARQFHDYITSIQDNEKGNGLIDIYGNIVYLNNDNHERNTFNSGRLYE